jgi:hypothetical protein
MVCLNSKAGQLLATHRSGTKLRMLILHLLLGAGAVYFASEMKALKDDCERFEIFPPGHIYSSKSGKVSSLLLALYPQN